MDQQYQDFQTFSFRGTSTSRDAPNPLRPYYIPPSIGLPPDQQPHAGGSRPPNASTGRSSFPAAARELFNDIDYESYIPDRQGDGSGVADMAKRLVDQAIWNYTSVLLAQPFEVAKIVLQCHHADSTAPSMSTRGHISTPSASSGKNGYAAEPGVR
jgi:fusion and transport protein UGO1